VAMKAVGSPPTPHATWNPSFSKVCANSAEDFFSCRANSGDSQICWATASHFEADASR